MAKVLGISGFYHDSAAALIIDGELVGAAQEERFSRMKHDPRFPHGSIRFCLERAGIEAKELDQVVFYEKPLKKFARIGYMFLSNSGEILSERKFSPLKAAARSWLGRSGKLRFTNYLRSQSSTTLSGFDWNNVRYVDHHYSHAASAFYPSPFDNATVLVMDGVGEWSTTTAYLAEGSRLERRFQVRYPDSLGLLYSAFTRYLGFRVNSGEYKLMGLAPYGEPVYEELIMNELVELREDGGFSLSRKRFDFWSGGVPVTKSFCDLFGGPCRPLDAIPSKREMNIAASIQKVIERCVLRFAEAMVKNTGNRQLCLAGGVALNCVSNANLMKSGSFDRVWIQPASGDAGGALGAAYLGSIALGDKNRLKRQEAKWNAYIGSEYNDDGIEDALDGCGFKYARFEDEQDLTDAVAVAISEGKVVGRFSGRMEFGPRALGNRSILGDPRDPEMQRRLNLKIKYRESFRPFAPSVLEEFVDEWFEGFVDSPYMSLIAYLKEEHRLRLEPTVETDSIARINQRRSIVPAVTHLDYSARLQVVDRLTNPSYHRLIDAFRSLTGVPMLINTSFNVRGEPIVESPLDAVRCFSNTEMDFLQIGSFWLRKEDQDERALRSFESMVRED